MAFSQQISVDSSVGLQQLIEDNFEQTCVEISNISSSVNGSGSGINSYGAFNRASSNFPFQSGIVLSTGNANSAGNATISTPLSDTSTTWNTDNDIETALGITNTTNATSIEFDLISAYNQLQFNYIFASEEYDDDFACNSGDSFVMLIKEAGTAAPYQNIALIPGTSTPIRVLNIREEINPISCPAQNNQYFDGFTLGDTNFYGRTTVLNASTSILPETTYHIKLIIADQPDGTFDSAVFIQSNTFNAAVDLGPDINSCSNVAPLSAGTHPSSANYQWYFNNNLISGAINSSYDATQDGTYRVVVTLPLNSQPCSVEDEIQVALNTEATIPANSVSPLTLCDDPSNGIGEETFTLNQKEADIQLISPFSNTVITYHETDADARNVGTPGIITANNLTTPTIFVRLYDIDNGCYAYTSFNLTVTALPSFTLPGTIPICDEDGSIDGITLIDLSQNDDDIRVDQTHLVTYHLTSNGAITGDNSIPDKTVYINTNTPTETIYARVLDINTTCVSAPIPLTLDISRAPTVATENTVYLDACDRDLDGFANFDLEEAIPDIVGTLTNYTPYFYENESDARAGNNNFIADPSNYINTDRNGDDLGVQPIYIRIEDNTTGCASVVTFEIHTNLLQTGTDLGEFALCDDDIDTTNSLNFSLSAVEGQIRLPLEHLPNPITVTFYETEEDRNNDNFLPKSSPYPVTDSTTLFVKIENGICTENGEITLRIDPPIIFPAIEDPVAICDTDTDGIVDIDLHNLDNLVTGGNPAFVVSYFLTAAAADTGTVGEIQTYPNASGTVEVHARITNVTPGITCHAVSTFEMTVFPIPIISTPTPDPICDTVDGDPNGFSVFDLNTVINDLVSNPTGLNIQFYKTSDAADIGDATSTNPDWIPSNQWSTFNTDTQEIFARVEESGSSQDCNPYAVTSFFIYVNTEPTIDPNLKLRVCKNNNATDPDVILEDYDSLVLNGQTGKEVFYYSDNTFTTLIPKTTPIPSFNGDIYIRVENITDPNGCFATATVPLVISDNPMYAPITPLPICEANVNGNYIFNLEDKAAEIKASSTDILNITFHKLESNAENNIQDITDNINYIGTANETLYIRIERDDTKCAVVEPLILFVFTIPETTDASPYILCDYDSVPDGVETAFDLTIAEGEGSYFEITDRFNTSFVTHYFRSTDDINYDDGLDNSKAIPNSELSAYISGSTTIQVKITNTNTGCFKTIPFELQVIAPPVFNNNVEIPECYNNSNSYDLTQVNTSLVNDTSLVTISYHLTENDASTNSGIYNANIFNYTTTGDNIIGVRIEDNTTQCVSTTSFTLKILPNPIANTTPGLVSCDDDFDGFFEFDLPTLTANTILGTQNASDYTITYYNDSANAEAGIDAIDNENYPASNGDIIYARIENNTTGCFDTTQFTTRINPLPIIPIDDIVPLCIDNLPLIISAETGNPDDTYLWSTGATTSEILLDDISDVGDYTVTVTRPYFTGDCSYQLPFTVIESEAATINFTTTIDFTDPNSITVDIDTSNLGNYVFILDDGEPQTSNIFENVTFGLHTVTVRDLNGCMDITREVFVFDIPKFVTPNNDGAYDTWHIVGANQLPGTIVYIYNRHGKLIKTLPYTSIGWDGTYNGENMPSDDYWFSADVIQNGNAFNLQGHFTLKR
ncbi:hypothetical protein GCM10022397_00690 [Flavivirga jejuensis]